MTLKSVKQLTQHRQSHQSLTLIWVSKYCLVSFSKETSKNFSFQESLNRKKTTTIERATVRREMFEVMQLRNCTKKNANSSCEKNQEQGSDGQEKEGRGFLLLSYKKVTIQCTRKKENDSGVWWSGLALQLLSKKLTSKSSWEQEKLGEPRKKSLHLINTFTHPFVNL